jgi:hypothetical protein
VLDRRRAPRTSAPLFGVGDAAVVRPGTPVWVVAISCAGALVESPAPIRPGVRTELTLDAAHGRRRPVGVEVLRCWVARLDPVRYHAAMRFEGPMSAG